MPDNLFKGVMFVGGNFHARVWTGNSFVDVYDIASYSGMPIKLFAFSLE